MNARILTAVLAVGVTAMLRPGLEAEGAVTVYGEATSSGEILTVELFADITDEAIVSFSLQLTYDPAVVEAIAAWKDEAVWYFWDGTAIVHYVDPDLSVPGVVVLYGGKLDHADPLVGVIGVRIPLGAAVFRRWNDEDPSFGIAPGPGSDYAGYVGVRRTVFDDLGGGVSFHGVEPDPGDLDLDGLEDDWETLFLNDPSQYSYHHDPDGDGHTNQEEQSLGTNPDDPDSGLRLNLRWQTGVLYAEWGSVAGKSYAVESSLDLQAYGPLQLGISATPPTNSYPLNLAPDVIGIRVYLEED